MSQIYVYTTWNEICNSSNISMSPNHYETDSLKGEICPKVKNPRQLQDNSTGVH